MGCCDETPCTPITPCTSTPCKYTGTNIDCVGILTGDTIELAFQKLSEYVCNLDLQNLNNQVVFYSERALGEGTVALDPALPTVISGATYTVPIGGDGDYEINYVGEATAAKDIWLKLYIYVNGLAYNVETERKVLISATVDNVPFTVFASQIALVAGDIIQIRGVALDNAITYPRNVICKITKLN